MVEQENYRSYQRGVQLGHLSLAHVGNLAVVIVIVIVVVAQCIAHIQRQPAHFEDNNKEKEEDKAQFELDVEIDDDIDDKGDVDDSGNGDG